VLVVDDSLTTRKRLIEALAGAPDLEVVGEAADGRDGVALCSALRPDLVTMDMVMPVMSGLAATEQIMARFPTPILVVSASADRAEAGSTFDALAAGAVDVLHKPGPGEPAARWAERLRAAARMAARIPVIRRPRARRALPATARREPERGLAPRGDVEPARAPGKRSLVALGGSTGAPAAVAGILERLPSSFPLPILLVIHLSPLFSASFADWLAGRSRLRVRVAADGDPIAAGVVLLAPPERHMILRDGRVRLTNDPERHSCRPSVDVLFESVAQEVGRAVIACLLSGMGADGAAGLAAIRRAGGDTVAQDEETSEIWGMPGAAVKLGAAARVLPIGAIAPALIAAASAANEPAWRLLR
jgi:two-component system chemotaxis response regulator CheB